jgi:hypothetical protein
MSDSIEAAQSLDIDVNQFSRLFLFRGIRETSGLRTEATYGKAEKAHSPKPPPFPLSHRFHRWKQDRKIVG